MNHEQQEIETFEEDKTYAVELGEALERLENNPDFKKVVMEEYLEHTALRQVSLLGVPQMKARGERPNLMEDLIAISNLKYFFWQIKQAKEGALNPILSDEEEAAARKMEEAEMAEGVH